MPHDGGDVHNEGDASVAHDGGAGNNVYISEKAAERLNDRLVCAEYAIDHKADALVFVPHNDDLLDRRGIGADAESAAEIDVRNQLAAHGDDVAAIVAGALGTEQLDVLGNGGEGNDELIAADIEEKSFDD